MGVASGRILIILALGLSLLLAACGGLPKAQVRADVTTGQAPLSVSFTNESSNADRFEWDFGGGATATTTDTKRPVIHVYTRAGTHTVTLKAIKEEDPNEASTTTLPVTVEPAPLDKVVLDITEVVLSPTQAEVFSAAAFDRFDNPIPGLIFAFRAVKEAGQVDSKGRFTAGTKAGTYEDAVTVEVTQGTITRSATASVTIKPGPLRRVVAQPTTADVEIATTLRFTAVPLDVFGNPIVGLPFTFRANEGAGQIDEIGNFTASIHAGSFADAVTVEVTQGTITRTATASVTIKPGPLHRVVVQPTIAKVEVATTLSFTAVALDEFDNPIAGLTFTFRADERAGQIDEIGNFTASTYAGTLADAVTVEVEQDMITKKATATVIATPAAPVEVKIEPSKLSIKMLASQPFSASAYDRFGNEVPDATARWSAVPSAGSVDSTGRFTAGNTTGFFEKAVQVEMTGGSTTVRSSADVSILPLPGVWFAWGATCPRAAPAFGLAGHTTNTEVLRPPEVHCSGAIAFAPDGTLYYSLYYRDAIYKVVNGEPRVVFRHDHSIHDFAFDSKGRLYVSTSFGSQSDGQIWVVEGARSATLYYTVRLSQLGGAWFGNFTFDEHDSLYLSQGNAFRAGIYKVTNDGVPVRVWTHGDSGITGLSFDKDGSLVYSNVVDIWKVDLSSGTRDVILASEVETVIYDVFVVTEANSQTESPHRSGILAIMEPRGLRRGYADLRRAVLDCFAPIRRESGAIARLKVP